MDSTLRPIKENHVISESKDMWVLASPVRMEVLNAVCALEECSAGEIAAFTCRSRTSLYPHIEQLVEAGLILEADVRLAGKRYEQLYHPIARTILIKHNPDDPNVVAYHQAHGKAAGRMMARLHERAASKPNAAVRGPLRDTYSGVISAWVDDESLKELNELIKKIWETYSASHPGEGKRLVNIGIMLAPNCRKD